MNQQTSSEMLEDVAEQFTMSKFASSQDRFNTMVAHIVTLREEIELLMGTFINLADKLGIDMEAAKSAPGKPSDVFYAPYAALESQLAEMRANSDLLRQGGEAVAYAVTERSNIQLIHDYDEFHLEFFRTSADAQQYINDEVLGLLEAGMGGEDVDLVALPLFTRPQPAIPPGYVVPEGWRIEKVEGEHCAPYMVLFGPNGWASYSGDSDARIILASQFFEAMLASAPAIQPAPDVEHVEDICEAYESGYGHGLKRDGLDGSRTPFADPMQQAAYQYGYECGAEKAGKQASAPSAPVAEKWQPIETAPKDGRRVLVWIDEGSRSQLAFAKLWFYEDGRLGGGAEGFNGKWNITHWMPLPAAPKEQGK